MEGFKAGGERLRRAGLRDGTCDMATFPSPSPMTLSRKGAGGPDRSHLPRQYLQLAGQNSSPPSPHPTVNPCTRGGDPQKNLECAPLGDTAPATLSSDCFVFPAP